MLNKFQQEGLPTLEILCECGKHELDNNEKEAFELFDPINNGLNIAEAAGYFPHNDGETNPFAKYEDIFIINLVLYLLRNKDRPLKVLAKEYGLHYSTVKNVANGTSHLWLANVIPYEYAELISLKGTRSVNSIGGKGITYIAISPQNEEYLVDNITKFANEHGLNRGAFGQVLNGKANQHKGWKLKI